jgi:cobalamin synthase
MSFGTSFFFKAHRDALAAFVAVVAFAVRRVGGYTGDVLGAAGVIAETAGLIVAAARW